MTVYQTHEAYVSILRDQTDDTFLSTCNICHV